VDVANGGGEGVADLKRIMISIPNSLLQEVDGIISATEIESHDLQPVCSGSDAFV
jgi:hypothetical protein